ncbi:MAG TPA: hypothetical protein DDX39_12085 [Bacteroidales bacterium]|nr:MAG: hypothetical protein A2W98_11490 [Bacteroidetes bacterium GWF2_33_38]OFY74858.1 MAG: hypothetical protein A2265_04065 [Bacteroidetes bacterium RIFOXYA12_FULL_33_9]OFY92064.1 MAG: hypothetical protein A2236_08900 [Bacteroidetes bacterium RIFOXYA2_FULL_33_7]HBF89371.1 hypothetical protein [Bacteroidales bacterium]
MNKYAFKITIEASNENDAETKMKALTVLASKLTEKELDKLAWIIKNDPAKTKLAKQYLGV